MYPKGMSPKIDFILADEDVVGTGAASTLFVMNNEVGFRKENIESLCSVGRSTKKGRRDSGYIGEKGKLSCAHCLI